jgi:hypothetical protein
MIDVPPGLARLIVMLKPLVPRMAAIFVLATLLLA